MNQSKTEEIVKLAALEAVKEYGKAIQRNKRVKIPAS